MQGEYKPRTVGELHYFILLKKYILKERKPNYGEKLISNGLV
jgi:hypothetical protein